MKTKNLIIIGTLILIILGYSSLLIKSAFTNYPPQTLLSLNDKTLLSVNFPLKPDHKLYMQYDASIVPRGKLFKLDAQSGTITQLNNVDTLSQITGPINTKEEALSFVKFFTSESTRHLLKPNPISGVEPSDSHVQIPNTLSKLFTNAKAEKIDGAWIIERDLIMYPNWANQEHQTTPAQLIRSHETISLTGTYTFHIGKVLAEGSDVNNLLPYYE